MKSVHCKFEKRNQVNCLQQNRKKLGYTKKKGRQGSDVPSFPQTHSHTRTCILLCDRIVLEPQSGTMYNMYYIYIYRKSVQTIIYIYSYK